MRQDFVPILTVSRIAATAALCAAILWLASAPAVWGEDPNAAANDEADATREDVELPRPGRPTAVEEKPRSIDDFSKPMWEWGHATGDWGGLRPGLEERGITPEVVYTGDVFSNLCGGRNSRHATEYLSALDMTMSFDTEKMKLWQGGTFFVYGMQVTGHGITEDHVGDLMWLDNLDADPTTQVGEYWYEHRLLDDKLRVKIGKQDANVDFLTMDFAGDFINTAFCTNPTAPVPTYPDQALGVAVFAEPVEWFWIGWGLYDGDADGGQWGFHSTFDGKGGHFTVVEAALKPAWGKEGRLKGKYAAGFWCHTADDWEQIVPMPEDAPDRPEPRLFSHNYGVYAGIDQALFREKPEEGDEQGLSVFGQFGWAPDDRNEIAKYYGGGVVYQGLIPGRDEDTIGFGVAHARLSTRMKHVDERTYETAIEWFYKIQLTEYMKLEPDVQYIINPGGDGRNAVAVGLRFEISF